MLTELAGRCETRLCNTAGEGEAGRAGWTMQGTFAQYCKRKRSPRSWPDDARPVRAIQRAKEMPTELAGRCEARSCNTGGEGNTHEVGRSMQGTFVQHSGRRKSPLSWPDDARHVHAMQRARIMPTELAGRCDARSCNIAGTGIIDIYNCMCICRFMCCCSCIWF